MFNEVREKYITVEAPASIANLGPCFDIAAIAIKAFKDEVKIHLKKGNGKISIHSNNSSIPCDNRNTAFGAITSLLSKRELESLDIEVSINKGIPISAGFGSSGATSAAVVFGLSNLLNKKLTAEELVYHAGNGEAVVSGTPHYDNVSASLLGGFVLVEPHCKQVIKLKPPKVYFSLITPVIKTEREKTKFARSIIPDKVDISIYKDQSFSIAKLILGISIGDLYLFGSATSNDFIVERKRSELIPFYWKVKEIAISEGALGFNISGAGPSLFAICKNESNARKVAESVSNFFISNGVNAKWYVTTPSELGARIIGGDV